MIRDICKDPLFLSLKSEPAGPGDLDTARDLLETLEAHREGCVGMAANMIGVNKRIIAFDNEGELMVMFNPEIVKKSGPYETEEGCLSLSGTRKKSAGSPLRWNIRMNSSSPGSKPSPAGPLRSFSMKSTTVTEFSFKEAPGCLKIKSPS